MARATRFRISDRLDLPVETMTETIAILAQKGFGKTYAAMKLAEEMITAGGQIVAFDPVGKYNYLGVLRTAKLIERTVGGFAASSALFP